jgi:hypothetical protein
MRTARFAGRVIDYGTPAALVVPCRCLSPRSVRRSAPAAWLWCLCLGCGVVGEIDLRSIDRHADASIESLIPLLSALLAASAVAKLIGLAAHPATGQWV